ncbi:hypothetical protein HYU07_06665 [Candidatus Woesearchaeota archaeon]|nr:hypothetical protein [Candidatus Woesearchaeota archaeon]
MKAHYEGLPVREFEGTAYYRKHDEWWRCSNNYRATINAASNLEFFYQKELEEKVVKITLVKPKSKTIDKLLKVA